MVGSVNLPRREKREAERRKAHLGNGRGLFPGSPENRGTRQRLSASRRGDLLASARSSKAQEASQRPADHDGFPAVTCTSPSHLVAGPHSRAGRDPKASRVCVCETQPRAPHRPVRVSPFQPALALSHFRTPLEAPLTGQDASRISEVVETGITIHANPKN